jgi:hypothetical protein
MEKKMRNPWELQQAFNNRQVDVFAKEVLGLPIEWHKGQVTWVNSSWKLINYLVPGNQWGKTLAIAVKHIFHACTKYNLLGRVSSPETWNNLRYPTLNVGKTYEVAKGVMEAIHDIVQGEVLLPDGATNKSILKDWAIIDYVDTTNKPPQVIWWNNSSTLIRSYDDLGSSFKRMRLAYVSSDECGDIPELRLFVNGTLLPRISFFRGTIDLIGTFQAKGIEYKEMVDEAELDIKRNGDQSDYYVQHGTLYENPFMNRDYIKRIENIADERLRKQIIYGQYVDDKQHFFTYEEIDNVFRGNIDYNDETGFSEEVDPEGYYAFSVDLAAAEDETAVTVLRYRRFIYNQFLQKSIELPYKVVFHKGFKGRTIPISMQYELIKSWYGEFTDKCKLPGQVTFIYDSGSLGGKNAQDAFRDLSNTVGFPGIGKSYPQEKAYAIGATKEVLARGRKVVQQADGKYTDIKKEWGFLRASAKLRELRLQFETYALDDKGIRQDRLVTVYQAVHWIEKRRPQQVHTKAIDMDILSSTIPNYGSR